jgi:hypothetical protein
MTDENALYYLRYAESAYRFNSREDFELAFLKLFESLCYIFYSKSVALSKCVDKNDAKFYSDDDDDDIELDHIDLEVKEKVSTKGQFRTIHLTST